MQNNIGNTSKGKIILTCYLYLLMMAYAVSVTMVGPVIPVLIEQYSLRLSQAGLVTTLQSVGSMLAIIAGGIIADYMRKSYIICAGFFLYIISLLLISISPSYGILLCIFFLLGAGTKTVDTIINAYVSDLHWGSRGLYLMLLHAFFGIGALSGPLFVRILLNRGVAWYETFRFLGIICLIVLAGFIILLNRIGSKEKIREGMKTANHLRLVKDKRVILLCLTMLMYTGHQSGITLWMPTFSEKVLKSGGFFSSYIVSLFWVGIITSRFIYPGLSKRFGGRRLLMLGSLLGGLLLVSAIIISTPFAVAAAVTLTGALTGVTFPVLITLGCSWYPENSGTVSSVIFLSSAVSSMFFPWLIGLIAEFFSLKTGMIITGTNLLVIPLLLLLLKYVQKESGGVLEKEGD